VHGPSLLSQDNFDRDIEVCLIRLFRCIMPTCIQDNQSHFYEALQQWRQLNLSPAFTKFSGSTDSLSASMPLLLHNWKKILDFWQVAIEEADDEALRALLEYVATTC